MKIKRRIVVFDNYEAAASEVRLFLNTLGYVTAATCYTQSEVEAYLRCHLVDLVLVSPRVEFDGETGGVPVLREQLPLNRLQLREDIRVALIRKRGPKAAEKKRPAAVSLPNVERASA